MADVLPIPSEQWLEPEFAQLLKLRQADNFGAHTSMTQSGHLQASKFDFMAIKAGDIIFVLPKASGFSRLTQLTNVHGQHLLAKIRRRSRLGLKESVRKYSHVMLGAGDGLIIHADGKKVALEVVTDALDFKSTRYQVFRHTGLTPQSAAQLARAGTRYMQQKYSFMSYFTKARDGDTTQFCSRLVAHAYRSVGMPLGELPDKDVLPLDLYLLCQQAPWTDVTAETVLEPLPPATGLIAGEIDIPGKGKLSMSEFFDSSDQLLLESLQFQKRFQEMQYKHYRDVLRMESLLADYCTALWTLARQMRADPQAIGDAYADKIARVLGQIGALLDLASLPDVELLVENAIAGIDPGSGEESAYVGMPTSTVLRELQIGRETLRYFTYLLMAETGLFSILAQIAEHEKLNAFRDIKPEYADRFLGALDRVDELEAYERLEHPYAWVGDESQRASFQQSYRNVINLLKLIWTAVDSVEPGGGTQA